MNLYAYAAYSYYFSFSADAASRVGKLDFESIIEKALKIT
jgi:hypothetical protein